MFKILDSLFDAVANVASYLKLKESGKWRDQYTNLKLQLMEEKKKGYDSDDAKIEDLYKKIQIIADAAKDELHAVLNQKP